MNEMIAAKYFHEKNYSRVVSELKATSDESLPQDCLLRLIISHLALNRRDRAVAVADRIINQYGTLDRTKFRQFAQGHLSPAQTSNFLDLESNREDL